MERPVRGLTERLRVDVHNDVVERARRVAAELNCGYILRLQDKKETLVNINNGRTEEIATGSLVGMGVQVFTAEGFSGFASSDLVSAQAVEDLLKRAFTLARYAKEAGGEMSRALFGLAPHQERRILPLRYSYGSLGLDRVEQELGAINKELQSLDQRLSVRTIHRLVDEEWRIARHDGTDVVFNTPRAFVYNTFTAKEGQETATTFANIPGSDLAVLLDPEFRQRLMKRSRKAAQLAVALLSAGRIKSGHYKLVIDYPLAKGLAHEAFGHAAETDGMETSILGRNGRMRVGEQVASSIVSIIDGPVEGDYAYQPISANGIPRETVTIVENGVLKAGLADLFSAEAAGVPVTGAGRVESCHHLPLARMTNIRIQVANPYPVEKPFEDLTPADLYELLRKYNLMEPGEEVLYLSGFQGGQVNPAFGNFVFNCSGIYRLGEKPVLYRGAIFSGQILSALQAVIAGLGPIQIDAMGTCGKLFQGVPSSGGSHYFLVLKADEEITIGGEAQ